MQRQVYMVSVKSKFVLTTRKKQAIYFARKMDGTVRSMPLSAYNSGGAWDFPTFWALSVPVYPTKEE